MGNLYTTVKAALHRPEYTKKAGPRKGPALMLIVGRR
jgi:hypothetical protein